MKNLSLKTGLKRVDRFIAFFIVIFLHVGMVYAGEYAFIYIENGTGANTDVSTNWTNVGAGSADDFSEGMTSEYWTFASNILTAANNAGVEGEYCIKYSLSFKADAADWYVGVSIDGAAPAEPIFVRSITNSRKDVGNVSGIYMTSISQGQTIQLMVKSSSGTPLDFTPVQAQLTVCPAAQSIDNDYAGMHIGTTASSTISTTFSQVAGFSAAPEMNGWTFGSNSLTAGAGSNGLYYLSFSVSYAGEGNESSPVIYNFEVARNDSNGISHILTTRSASSTDVGNVSGGGLINIKENDIISLEVKSHLANKNLSIRKATISLFKLGDTSPNSTGGMTITSDQSVTINAESEWTTIGSYSLAGANNWDLNSNIFTLNASDAYGYYHLEFTTSLITASASGDEFEIGVFIGSTLNPSFTVRRALSSNTDVGAVCGVGLFQADGPDSTVSIKIQNVSSDNDFTIKKSMVGFSQIRYVASDTPLPIMLSKFETEPSDKGVKLSWQTASEVENLGFRIYRKENGGAYKEIISYAVDPALEGAGTTADVHNYEYLDQNIEKGNTYTYLLADMSYHMEEFRHKDLVRTVFIPEGMILGEAYPNPFNPRCIIPFNIDTQSRVVMDIMDLSGRKVRTLANEIYSPGSHKIEINEPSLRSGVYFLRVRANGRIYTQKLLLMK